MALTSAVRDENGPKIAYMLNADVLCGLYGMFDHDGSLTAYQLEVAVKPEVANSVNYKLL